MNEKFSDSKNLKEIIESHGWTLFDATQSENRRKPLKWSELESKGPALEFEIGHNYIFAPIPQNGQTLRDAYSITKGLGPSIKVEDLNDERWAGYYIIHREHYYRTKIILFSRLNFTPTFLGIFSPPTRDMPNSDKLALYHSFIIDTFKKNFRIVSPEEYNLTTPIQMVFHLEDN